MAARHRFIRLTLVLIIVMVGLFQPDGRAYALAPELNKSFSPTTINPGEKSTITVQLFNPNPGQEMTNVTFSDTLPAGMFIADPLAVTNTCGGSVTAVAGGGSFSLSGGTIPGQVGATPGMCAMTIEITTTVQGNLINTIPAGNLTGSLPGGITETNTTPASATLTVRNIAQLSLVKLMNPNTFYSGATSRLTLRITNNDNTVTLTNVALTDDFPPELSIYTTPGVATSNCGSPTVIATPGATQVAISGATIAPRQQCDVTLTVTQTATGSYTNTIPAGSVTSNQGVTNQDAYINYSVQANVLNITKNFAPTPVMIGETSVLTITVANPNPVVPATGVSITDNLPAGITVANPAGISSSCPGLTLAANPGDTSLPITGSVSAGTTCTVRVNVTSTVANVYVNEIPPGNVSSGNGFASSGSASASIAFNGLTLGKSFTPSAIQVGGTSRLRILFTNPGIVDLVGLSLTDAMPAGISIASPANPATTCPAGTVTSTASSITANGLTIPASGSCYIEIDVTSSTINVDGYVNDIPANAATIGGTPVLHNPTSARLQVVSTGGGGTGAPIGSKTFNPTPVQVGQTSRLTITIQAPTEALSSIAFTDALPAGVVVAANPNVNNSCGGTVTAAAGSGTISLTGGSITGTSYPQSCTVQVNVVSNSPGAYTNLMAAGSITASAGGTPVQNAAAFQAALNVNASISGSKSFAPTSINSNGTSTMTIRINAPAGAGLSNVAYTDTLPAGMIVATPNNLTTTGCGAGTVSAAPGSGTVALSGATIAAGGNCQVSVSVTAPNASGNLTNSLPIGAVTGQFAGGVPAQNTTAISRDLSVTGLTVAKQFNPATISPTGRSTLIITIRNYSSQELTSLALTDNLPNSDNRRLRIANPPNASTTCGTGTVGATAGATTITLTGGQIQSQVGGTEGICTIAVDVEPQNHNGAYTSGAATNRINAGQVTSAQGINNRAAASANLNFLPLVLNVNKSFNPLLVTGGQSSVLTVEIENPQGVAIEDAQFVDNLPAGMQVFLPANLTLTGCGTTWSSTGTTPGSTSFSFSGLDIAANSTCRIAIQVTSTVSGNLTNTIPAGGVTSKSGATNAQAASASLTYTPGLGVAKAFTPDTIPVDGTSTVTIQIINTNGFAITSVNLTDTLPAGVTIASPVTTSTTCGSGTVNATAGGDSIALVNGSLSANQACQITAVVTAAAAGTYLNDIPANAVDARDPSDNPVTNPTGTDATLTVTASADLSITKSDNPDPVLPGDTLTYTVTVNNAGPSDATDVVVTDTLPAGVTFDSTSGCAEDPAGVPTCSLGTIAAGDSASYTVTVTVDAATSGVITNSVSVTSNTPDPNARNNTDTEDTTVTPSGTADLSIVKSDNPDPVLPGDTLTYTVTVSNAGQADAADVVVTDTLPAGVTFSSTSGCAEDPAGVPACSLGTIAAGSSASYTITVSVDPATAGTITNTASVSSSTPDPNPNNNTDTEDTFVGTSADLSITKSDNPDPVLPGDTLTYTVTVNNAGPSSATDVVVTDTLPAGVTFASTSGCAEDPAGVPTCSLGTIAAGGSASYTITVTADAATSGVVTNTASVTSNTPDPDTSNNTDTEDTTVAPPGTAELRVTKSDNPDPVQPGGTLTYTITVTNAGPADADDVVATDTLPAGVTFVSTAGCAEDPAGVPTCSLGTIAAGSSASYTVTVTVDPATTGTITNTVSVTSSTPDPNPGTNTDTEDTTVGTGVQPTPVPTSPPPPPGILVFDPAISKVGYLQSGGVGLPGERLTWEFTITNIGTAPGTNVVITDTIASALRIDSVWIETGTAAVAGQTVTFTIPVLNPGQTVRATIVTIVLVSPLDVENVANLSGVGPNNDPVTRSAQARVTGISDLPSTGYPPPDAGRSALPIWPGLVTGAIGVVVSFLAGYNVLKRRRS